MTDEIKNPKNEEAAPQIIVLTDQEDGSEQEFKVLAEYVRDGKTYFALRPLVGMSEDEFVILEFVQGEEGDSFYSIEDPELEDDIADAFFDLLFDSEIDYDA